MHMAIKRHRMSNLRDNVREKGIGKNFIEESSHTSCNIRIIGNKTISFCLS